MRARKFPSFMNYFYDATYVNRWQRVAAGRHYEHYFSTHRIIH